ncbi:hypothetical protein T08_10528, partial [Trichinella sp. T8]
LDPSRAHEAPGSMLRAAEAQKAQVAGLPMRNDRPVHTRTPTLGARLVLPSATDGHMVGSSENEVSPRHATAMLEAEKQGSQAIDEHPDVESRNACMAELSTGREEIDGMRRCPPGKPGEVSDGRVTLPSGGSMFRTEQHRLSRCDLARGWWPKVA